MTQVSQVHPRSLAGYTKEHSGHYDRSMPTYQPTLYSYLRKSVDGDLLNVVEIGAGTGIFTRGLLAHPEWKSSVAAYKAVEPSDGMREVFSQTVNDERVTISEGTFDCTGVEDEWADFVVIATALLWCLDYDAAATEFRRILKPGRMLFLPCVCLADNRVGWTAKINSLDERFAFEPTFFSWRKLYDSPVFKDHFKLLEEQEFHYDLIGTVEGLKNHAKSWTPIAIQDSDEKEKVVRELEDIIENADDSEREWVDKGRGILKIPYDAVLPVICRK